MSQMLPQTIPITPSQWALTNAMQCNVVLLWITTSDLNTSISRRPARVTRSLKVSSWQDSSTLSLSQGGLLRPSLNACNYYQPLVMFLDPVHPKVDPTNDPVCVPVQTNSCRNDHQGGGGDRGGCVAKSWGMCTLVTRLFLFSGWVADIIVKKSSSLKVNG